MAENIINISDESFETDVLNADEPILVDYWAEWCGPCKSIAPLLEEVAKEYSGRIRIGKLDIEQNKQTPPKYNIRGIPTLMIFKNGHVEATKVGMVNRAQLTEFIEEAIG